jgi:hypothetical protein
MCYSALQDSTPQLTMTVYDNLPERTQDRTYRDLSVAQNRTTLAPAIN